MIGTFNRMLHKYEDLVERLVPDDTANIECTKTLVCAAGTHKRACYARTVSIDWYVKRIKDATL